MKEYRWRRRQMWLFPLAVLCGTGAIAFPLLAVAASYYQWGGTAVWLSAAGFLVCYAGFLATMRYGQVRFEEVAGEIRDGLEDGSVVVRREEK